MIDIVSQLRKPVNEKEDYFISQWPNEEPKINDAIRFKAAAEIERLRAALREIIADSFSVYAIQVARAALEEKHD